MNFLNNNTIPLIYYFVFGNYAKFIAKVLKIFFSQTDFKWAFKWNLRPNI